MSAPTDEVNGIAFRDVLMNALLGMAATLIIIMAVTQVQAQLEASAEPPGNLTVYAKWDDGDIDVDLWLDGPAEPVPVGYSNKGGLVWNLLRDDLGDHADALGATNFENAYSRGVVPGSYSIALHCYRCPTLPVTATVVISMNDMKAGKSSSKTLLTSKVEISRQGQEKTVANFKLNADGTIDKSTLNNIYRPLRSAKKERMPQ